MNAAQVHAQVFLSAREMVHVRVRSLVSRAADSQVLGDVSFVICRSLTEGAYLWEYVQTAVRVPIWDEVHEYVRGRA